MEKHHKGILFFLILFIIASVLIWESKPQSCYYGFYFKVTHRYTSYYCLSKDKVWNGSNWRKPSPHQRKQINKIIK